MLTDGFDFNLVVAKKGQLNFQKGPAQVKMGQYQPNLSGGRVATKVLAPARACIGQADFELCAAPALRSNCLLKARQSVIG